MHPKTLAAFKQQARKFSNLYEILVENWNGKLVHGNNATYPHTVLIQVLVHNIAFHSPNAMGYNHEKAVIEVESNLKALEAINNYHNQEYMTHYPWTELSSLWDGMSMSEDYENNRY